MKPFMLVLLLLSTLYGDAYTQKLYETILGSIFTKRPIVLFARGNVKRTLEKSSLFHVVSRCQGVDVAVVGNDFTPEKECKGIPIFATTHRSYGYIADAFGAFYWRKGRPQIHFRERGLRMFHLKLPTNLQRFVDEE